MPDAALTSDGAPKESAVLERLEEIEKQLGVIQTQTARSTVDWYKRILDTVQAFVVIGGVVVAVQQLIQVRKSSYQTAYDTVSKEWLQMDRYFVEKKDLRPYLPHRPRQRRCESWLDGALCWLGLK